MKIRKIFSLFTVMAAALVFAAITAFAASNLTSNTIRPPIANVTTAAENLSLDGSTNTAIAGFTATTISTAAATATLDNRLWMNSTTNTIRPPIANAAYLILRQTANHNFAIDDALMNAQRAELRTTDGLGIDTNAGLVARSNNTVANANSNSTMANTDAVYIGNQSRAPDSATV